MCVVISIVMFSIIISSSIISSSHNNSSKIVVITCTICLYGCKVQLYLIRNGATEGSFVKLQPVSSDFLDIHNPRAVAGQLIAILVIIVV